MKRIGPHLSHAIHALTVLPAQTWSHGALILTELLLALWLIRRFTGSFLTSRSKGAGLETNLNHASACAQHLATTSTELLQRTGLQVARSAAFAPSWERLTAWLSQTLAVGRNLQAIQADQRARALSYQPLFEEMAAAVASITVSGQETAKLLAEADEVAFLTHVVSLNVSVQAAHSAEPDGSLAAIAEELRVLARRSTDASKAAAARVQDSLDRAGATRTLIERMVRLQEEVAAANTRALGLLANFGEAEEAGSWVEQVNSALQAERFAQQENVNSAAVNAKETARLEVALQMMATLLDGVAKPQPTPPAGIFDDSGVLCQPQT